MKVLHISDIHFGKDHYFKTKKKKDQARFTLTDAIVNALNEQKMEIDHLIISGDIFDIDQEAEYLIAQSELENLFAQLSLDKNNITIVPGNHDVDWAARFNNHKFGYYDKLLETLGQKEQSSDQFPIIHKVSENQWIIGLNSCVYENKEYNGLGRIGEIQLNELSANNEIKEFAAQPGNTLIAVLHHHLLPVHNNSTLINLDTENKHDKLSTTLDSVNVLRVLSKIGVSHILTGHQHQNAIYKHLNVKEKLAPINLISVGSVGLQNSVVKKRSFNVYEFKDRDMLVHPFAELEDDPNYFSKESTITLSSFNISTHQAPIFDVCNTHLEYSKISSNFESKILSDDYSNLYLLFISVVDCKESRVTIKHLISDLKKEGLDVELVAMYDLLGKWDLLVMIRLNTKDNFTTLVGRKIRSRLLETQMMKRRGDYFTTFNKVDVHREAGSLKDIMKMGRIEYTRRILFNSENYDIHRIQKGIIYIDCEKKDVKHLLNSLWKIIEGDEFNDFIECVYQSTDPNVLLIEFFTKCSEYTLINRFNRAISPVLAEFELQKYNLLYYAYDETISTESSN